PATERSAAESSISSACRACSSMNVDPDLRGRYRSMPRCANLLRDQCRVEFRQILTEHRTRLCRYIVALQANYVALRILQDVEVTIQECSQGTDIIALARHDDLHSQVLQVAHGGDSVAHVHLVECLVEQNEAHTFPVATLQSVCRGKCCAGDHV